MLENWTTGHCFFFIQTYLYIFSIIIIIFSEHLVKMSKGLLSIQWSIQIITSSERLTSWPPSCDLTPDVVGRRPFYDMFEMQSILTWYSSFFESIILCLCISCMYAVVFFLFVYANKPERISAIFYLNLTLNETKISISNNSTHHFLKKKYSQKMYRNKWWVFYNVFRYTFC